jgi:ABC-2 type transport system permease protein
MRKTLLVAWREYSEAVKSKGFIVGIALAPIFMFGGIGATVLMEGKADASTQKFAVVDRSGQLGPLLQAEAEKRNDNEIKDKAGKQVRPRYEIELIPPLEDKQAQRIELSNKVRSEGYRAFVEIGKQALAEGGEGEDARVGYYSDRAAMDDARGWFSNAVNGAVRARRLKEAGIAPAALERLNRQIDVQGIGLLNVDDKTGKVVGGEKSNEAAAFLTPFIFVMLLYMMVMFGSMPQIHAVMEEKTQRIAEVLLGSLSPFQLMAGKLLGNLSIAVTTGLVYLGLGAAAAAKMNVMDSIPVQLVPWFFVYLVLAVAMYGAAAIAVGAAVNDAKEAQSLTMPVILPLIVPLFMLVPIMKEPNGLLATVISFVPPCTPLTMLLRQASPGGVPAWQPWLGLAVLVVSTVIYIWAAGRVFRIGLLSQGKTPKFSELVRWAIRG